MARTNTSLVIKNLEEQPLVDLSEQDVETVVAAGPVAATAVLSAGGLLGIGADYALQKSQGVENPRYDSHTAALGTVGVAAAASVLLLAPTP
jgi:hypothetical protein